MSLLYGLGHASVVAAIALGFLLMSFALLQGVDRFMETRMLPRWALVANVALNSYGWLKAKLTRTPRKHHHVLKSAGAAAQKELGAIIIVMYSLGLVTTNTLMGVLGAYGYIKSSERQRLYRSAAFVTGSFSMVIGILFLFGGISYLPSLEAMIGG